MSPSDRLARVASGREYRDLLDQPVEASSDGAEEARRAVDPARRWEQCVHRHVSPRRWTTGGAEMEAYDDDRTLGSILESLPDPVVAGLEVRDTWRKQLAESTAGLE